jgi:hypothetical protein
LLSTIGLLAGVWLLRIGLVEKLRPTSHALGLWHAVELLRRSSSRLAEVVVCVPILLLPGRRRSVASHAHCSHLLRQPANLVGGGRRAVSALVRLTTLGVVSSLLLRRGAKLTWLRRRLGGVAIVLICTRRALLSIWGARAAVLRVLLTLLASVWVVAAVLGHGGGGGDSRATVQWCYARVRRRVGQIIAACPYLCSVNGRMR